MRPAPPVRLAGVVLAAGALLGAVPAGGAAAGEVHRVEVVDNGYAPARITVEVGDTVRWVWTGDNPHSVSAVTGGFNSHPGCSVATSGPCGGRGETFSHTFHRAGEFSYTCRFHLGSMVGTVVVQEASGGTQAAPSGGEAAAPAPQPPGAQPPGPAPPQPPARSAGSGGGGGPDHVHGYARGPRVGTQTEPVSAAPPVPQVADPSPRPVPATSPSAQATLRATGAVARGGADPAGAAPGLVVITGGLAAAVVVVTAGWTLVRFRGSSPGTRG